MNNKKVISSIVVVLILGVLYWFVSSEQQITNYPSSGTGIIAFGDSLVAGVGATEGSSFVDILEQEIGQPILNLGVPGDTTIDGLARIESVTRRNPEVVMLLLGGNDALRRISKEETRANLYSLISEIQESGAVVVLLGVRGGLLGDGYKDMYEDLSRELGTAYVSDVLKGLFGKVEFMSDSVHPNNKGYAYIAQRVLPVLESVIK